MIMEINKDVDVMIKDIAKCKALTADEEFKLTEAVKEKGTDCDEMKKFTRCTTALLLVLQGNT